MDIKTASRPSTRNAERPLRQITPCLWFDGNGEDAARFYVSIFPNSEIRDISHYTEAGTDIHGQPEGKVMVVAFTLDGQEFVALNGGPQFKFDEAISFQVPCETQEDIDYYWEKLTAGGGQEGPCGWVKDKFGLSWQVVPNALLEMLGDKDKTKVVRVTDAFMKMKKFDVAKLRQAFEG